MNYKNYQNIKKWGKVLNSQILFQNKKKILFLEINAIFLINLIFQSNFFNKFIFAK